MIPGVLYAAGKDAVAVAVSPREISAILKSASGENTLFDLDLGGSRRKVILKEFQREPLRGKLLHADFYEVALDKALQVSVHIELTGTPVGRQAAGRHRRLRHARARGRVPAGGHPREDHDRHLAPRAEQAPARLRPVTLGDKVKVLAEPEVVIVHVVLPKAEVVTETAAVEGATAEAGAAEPEVIKKGKTDAEAADEKPEKGAGGKAEKKDKK